MYYPTVPKIEKQRAVILHSLSSYKKTHHSDALLHQYFDELLSKNPYSNRKLYPDFPGVVVCLAPLSLQGLFSLSCPTRLVQNMVLPVHHFTLAHRNVPYRNTFTVHRRLGTAYQRVP